VPLRLESSQYRAGGWMEALDRASAGGFPRHLLEAAGRGGCGREG
jgi:hypothetical protein